MSLDINTNNILLADGTAARTVTFVLGGQGFSIGTEDPGEKFSYLHQENAGYKIDEGKEFTWEIKVLLSTQALQMYDAFVKKSSNNTNPVIESFNISITQIGSQIYYDDNAGPITITEASITSFNIDYPNESVPEVTISGIATNIE